MLLISIELEVVWKNDDSIFLRLKAFAEIRISAMNRERPSKSLLRAMCPYSQGRNLKKDHKSWT